LFTVIIAKHGFVSVSKSLIICLFVELGYTEMPKVNLSIRSILIILNTFEVFILAKVF